MPVPAMSVPAMPVPMMPGAASGARPPPPATSMEVIADRRRQLSQLNNKLKDFTEVIVVVLQVHFYFSNTLLTYKSKS